MNKKSKIGLIVLAAIAVILTAGGVTAAMLHASGEKGVFAADGYVLGISQESEQASVYPQSFASGTVLTKKFPSSYAYQDVEGDKVSVAEDSFIHYSDGSLSALTNGVAVDASAVNDGVTEFYSLDERMVMAKESKGWSIDNNSKTLDFEELLWMLTKEKLMAASSEMTVYLSNGESHKVSGALEITYLDEGIVQLATETDVWQTLASNTKIHFASGTVLDLGEGMVYNDAQTACFSVKEMEADMNSAVNINSTSAGEWIPPTFKVTAENGEDGTDGEAGTEGEAGEEGKEGEKGEEGKAGEKGAKGGTPGTASDTDNTVTSSTMGTIRISSMQYTASAATFYLTVSDDDGTLTANSGDIEIREADSNKLVWSYKKAYGTDTLDLTTVNSNTAFLADSGLNPDTEYVLIVKNGYSIQSGSGTTTGTKTFVNRHFFTSTEGISMREVKNLGADEENATPGLRIMLDKQSYSTAKSAMIRMEIGDKYVEREFSVEAGAEDYYDLLFDAGLLSEMGIETSDPAALNNKEYKLILYTSESYEGSGAFERGDDGSFKLNVQKSAHEITGKTLKSTPTFGSLEALNSNQGYYALTQNVESDPDGAITGYTFLIADSNGTKVAELQSTSGSASWYFKETGNFTITSKVTWNDNEKTIEKDVAVQNVSITTQGTPVITFEAYTLQTKTGDNFYFAYNSKGEKVDTVYNFNGGNENGYSSDILFSESRAWGDLTINLNGAKLDNTKKLTIQVTCDKNTYSKSFDRTATVQEGEITFPLQLAGLTENAIYTITVSGTVLRTTTMPGGQDQTSPVKETLGRCFFKTGSYRKAETSDQTPAAFEMSAYGGKVYVQLPKDETYKTYNSTEITSAFYKERAAASAIEFTVYNSFGNETGKFVKSIYDVTSYAPSYVANSDGQGRDYKALFQSPLVNGWNESGVINITEEDLKNAGVTDTKAGEISIAATALYDYNYYLSQNNADYVQEFGSVDEIHYNRIPLKVIKKRVNGVENGECLNWVKVDLGAREPELPTAETADQDIKVTAVTNGDAYASSMNASINKYGKNTVVGYRLHSNYANSNGDTNSITYYAMWKEAYQDYVPGSSLDPVQEYLTGMKTLEDETATTGTTEDKIRSDSGIRFAVEVSASASKKGSVPELHVFVSDKNWDEFQTDNELKGYWKFENGVFKAMAKESNGNYSIFVPKNWMPRGYNYVFAYTVKSNYGVDATGEAWTYPYDIEKYVTSQKYAGKQQLPRSSGDDFSKEKPTVASYLVHTMKNGEGKLESRWRYYVYDPDNALVKDSGKYCAIATTQENYKFYAQNLINTKKGTSGNVPYNKLDVTVGSSNNSSTYTADKLFGAANEKWKQDDISVFDVVVKDNGVSGSEMHLAGTSYSIWLEMNLFEGKYNNRTGGTQSFQDWCLTADTEGYNYWLLKTVSQKPDITDDAVITGTGDQALKYTLTPSDSTEKATLSIEGDTTALNAIAAVYYEIYENDDDQLGTCVQSGTVNFDGTTADINMTYATPGKNYYVKVSPVYDTGYAATELRSDEKTSNEKVGAEKIVKPERSRRGPTNDNDKGYYYAVQTLGTNSYATSLNLGADKKKYQFSFSGSRAYGSIFEIKEGSLAADEAGVYAITAEQQLAVYNKTAKDLQIGYGSAGAYNVKENTDAFAFKLLTQKDAQNLQETPGKVTIKDFDEQKYFSLEAADRVPTVIARRLEKRSPVSDSLQFTITESTIEMLKSEAYIGDAGEGRIYLEVWEGPASEKYTGASGDTNFTNISDQGKETSEAGLRLFENATCDDRGVYITLPDSDSLENLDDGYEQTLRLRNLTPGMKYYIRLYYYKKDGSDYKKAYFTDGAAITGGEVNEFYYDALGQRTDNQDFCLCVVQEESVNMGLVGVTNASELKAEYKMTGYMQQGLNVKYTTTSTEGMEYELTVLKADGTTELITYEKLMKVLGYQRNPGKTKYYWNYDNKRWTSQRDLTYYKVSDDGLLTDTAFSSGYINTPSFLWMDGTGSVMDVLSNNGAGGSYVIQVKALYEDPFLKVNGKNYAMIYRYDKNGKQDPSVEADTTQFSVAAKADPTMTRSKALLKKDAEGNIGAVLNLYVSDLSYRLGFYETDAATAATMGYYGVRIKYQNSDGTGEWTYIGEGSDSTVITVDGKNGEKRNGYLYLKADKQATLNFSVLENKQYVVEVWGYSLNDPDELKNQRILDSTGVLNLNQSLNTGDIDAPRIEDSKTEFNQETGDFTITLYNGVNLDKLNMALLTLTGYSTDGTQWNDSYSYAFNGFTKLPDAGGRTRHQITISLKDRLESAKQNDAINITTYFNIDNKEGLTNIATYNLDSYDKPKS